LSSGDVAPGGSVTVTDQGWQPDSTVDLSLHSTPVALGTATTGDDGSFSKTVTIPADTTLGVHTIEITGTDANQQPATHSVEVDVVSAEGTTVTTVHTSGTGGTLPFTGGSTLPLLFIAVSLLGGGVAMAARRRQSQA
jgi:5'-nucleotidase